MRLRYRYKTIDGIRYRVTLHQDGKMELHYLRMYTGTRGRYLKCSHQQWENIVQSNTTTILLAKHGWTEEV